MDRPRAVCRAAYRDHGHPSDRDDDLGFRFVRGQAAPGGPEGPVQKGAEPPDASGRGATRAIRAEPEAGTPSTWSGALGRWVSRTFKREKKE